MEEDLFAKNLIADINDDLLKLDHHQLGRVYKFIRRDLIANIQRAKPLDAVEVAKTGAEQRKGEICPTCSGDGIARDGGYPNNGKCGVCGGTGKLSPVS